MLKSVDVLIGLVVVLLALSMAVTVITQAITSALNSRGSHLRRGLMDLLELLDPKLGGEVSKQIATAVLRHPLVSGSNVMFTGTMRLGTVIYREELTKLLMGLAQGESGVTLDAGARAALVGVLERNGIAEPAKTLKTIQSLALELEAKSPGLSSTARQEIAILSGARSDFVAKINTWFDQTVDRTSQRFTASTRAITLVGALIVAGGLQVDTLSVVNRLAADDKMREAFVAQAKTMQTDRKDEAAGTAAAETPPPAPTAGGTTAGTPAAAASASTDAELDRKYRSFLAEHGVIKLPSEGWSVSVMGQPGILLTVLLLSLGAPFWYSMLGKLLQLRSVLAFKDDERRKARQDDGGPGPSGGTPANPNQSAASSIVAGERGDLTAVG